MSPATAAGTPPALSGTPAPGDRARARQIRGRDGAATGATAPLISARGLALSLDGREVLRDVDLDVRPGEIITIVGPNGSGKSSLLRALIGAIRPARGQLTRKAGLRIGYVPQKLAIDPTLPMTVERFLSLPRRIDRTTARAALARTGAEGLALRQMTRLSGGQFQRVLLARALLARPELLLLDEATQGLDQPGAAAFYRLIEEIRGQLGCAIVMISHDLHVVMAASDRVLCVNGHICCEGAPELVASAPEYQALFGSGTQGTLALYRHEHSHHHHHDHDAHHHHAPGHDHVHAQDGCAHESCAHGPAHDTGPVDAPGGTAPPAPDTARNDEAETGADTDANKGTGR